jgi:hypothetical protein
LIVTESSRLDRREDLDAQAEILLAIRSAGGDIVSIGEPQFGRTDFAGRIVTLVAQHANAEKSKTVKRETYRGIMMIRDNKAHHGALPAFWATKGVRYAKQAWCQDPLPPWRTFTSGSLAASPLPAWGAPTTCTRTQ